MGISAIVCDTESGELHLVPIERIRRLQDSPPVPFSATRVTEDQ